MIENDPFSRLKFRCQICLSNTLVMIADDGDKTEVLDLFPSLDDKDCQLNLVFSDTSFKDKTPSFFRCGDCGKSLENNGGNAVASCLELVQWLKTNQMIDE